MVFPSPRCQFQSTLPARGATRFALDYMILVYNFNPRSPHGERHVTFVSGDLHPLISIHAPRTGSDRRWAARVGLFQQISIHAPRTGSDQGRARQVRGTGISIHAPRTGSDRCRPAAFPRPAYFNPRSPHGERHGIAARKYQRTTDFNPRSPHGERLCFQALLCKR